MKDLLIKKRDLLAKLQDLPEHCLSIERTTGEPIGIRRGELGYYPIRIGRPHGVSVRELVDGYNQERGITPAQVLAMENGSLFAWDTPSADPELCAQLLARAEARS